MSARQAPAPARQSSRAGAVRSKSTTSVWATCYMMVNAEAVIQRTSPSTSPNACDRGCSRSSWTSTDAAPESAAPSVPEVGARQMSGAKLKILRPHLPMAASSASRRSHLQTGIVLQRTMGMPSAATELQSLYFFVALWYRKVPNLRKVTLIISLPYITAARGWSQVDGQFSCGTCDSRARRYGSQNRSSRIRADW